MAELEKTPQNFDAYISRLFAPEDDALQAARDEMHRGGLPKIYVSPSEGKLLQVLALLIGARRILEIGTLGGYSTTWFARALPPGGTIVSLEIDPHHADVARTNLQRAGVADKATVLVGPALETLARITAEKGEPFDLVFIDADKDGYPAYLEYAVPLVREGGVILGDNALSRSVLDPAADNGITRYNNAVAAHPDLISVIIPVLRDEIDGLLVSIKRTH